MTSRASADGTAPTLDMDSARSTQPPVQLSSLHHLPHNLLELVLQYLTLAEQLNHASHLCKHLPPPTSTSIRYATLLLTEDTVWHIARSPRLFTLLSAATSVVVQLDTVPHKSHAVQFMLSTPNVDVLFPHLAHFSHQVSAVATEDALSDRRTAVSILPLLPFLSARSASLHSLHLAQCRDWIGMCRTLPPAELPTLLAPLTSLRRLRVDNMTMWIGVLPYLLTLPLEALDLSTCTTLHYAASADIPWPSPPIESVGDCALLRSCHTLRLPRQDGVHPSWLAYVEALVAQRTDSTRPHTLSIEHMPSATNAKRLVDKLPAHSLSVYLEGADSHVFLFRAAAPRHSIRLPRRMHVTVDCKSWNKRGNLRPFASFVASHHARLRSLTLTSLPPQSVVTSAVLAVVLQCASLEVLHMSTSSECGMRALAGYGVDTQLWAADRRLERLHTLHLDGLRDEQGRVCQLLSACPALRLCTLGVPGLSFALVHTLATSCPLLSHLHVLDVYGLWARTQLGSQADSVEEEPAPPATPFCSLVQLDLYYTAQSRDPPAEMAVLSRLHPFLAGSPLRRLTLLIGGAALYQPALTALLAVMPGVESVVVTSSHCRSIAAPRPSSVWDNEADVQVAEDTHTLHGATPRLPQSLSALLPLPSVQPSTERPASSLVSLELIMSSRLLAIDHLSALLAHCPALTSIRLAIHDKVRIFHDNRLPETLVERDVLLTLLHCLATVGQHCPLIEHISFRIQYDMPPPIDAVRVLGLEEVRGVVDACQLPDHAFARLQRVREVGGGVDMLSSDAAEYVRRQWLSGARGAVSLDWNTHPS